MGKRCLNCFRPLENCFCGDLRPVDTGVKFVFLMHPHEAYRQKTGTGRLAALSLTGSRIIIGRDFDANPEVRELIADPSFFPMVLYPGKDASMAESFRFSEAMERRTLLIFLIDATWTEARKMMHRSESLRALPRLSFSRAYRSSFSIKTQPQAHCLSTIESSYYLVKELQKAGVCDPEMDAEGLMAVFEKMVNFQIVCEKRRRILT
jgi:DTW domain-containing protein YfiP